MGDTDFDKLPRLLDVAANCCIALGTGLPNRFKHAYILLSELFQLYSGELIAAYLDAIKNQLSKILHPLLKHPLRLASISVMTSLFFIASSKI